MIKKFTLLFCVSLLSVFCSTVFATNPVHTSTHPLIQQFDSPSNENKPWTFWYWINGNITKEGIRADLESMAAAGLGGVVIMHINEHGMIPPGPVRFLSDDYKALLKYMFTTAAELDLKVNMYNSEGWSVAGGPWITPELGMKELAWSEINITHKNTPIIFPKPHAPLSFYQDIATLAFPTPQGFIEPDFTQLVENIEVSNQTNTKIKSQHVIDKDWNTQVSPTKDPKTGETFITLNFKKDYTFSNAFIKFAAYGMMGRNFMMVSNDGQHFQEIAFTQRGQIYDDIGCFEFDPVTARHVKFVFKPTDNKLLYTAMPKVSVSVREIMLDNRKKIKSWCKKAAHAFPFFDHHTERTVFSKTSPTNSTIALDSIIDVSQYLDQNGTLNWTPPSDNWTIIRFGMASTEAINRPSSVGGEGLEVDKLNAKALDTHFNGLLKEAKQLVGAELGKTFYSTHADSWEVGRQNWTQGFEHRFEQNQGYSPIKYLPATLGYIINNADTSERFLWDFRKTIADLIAKEFYGGMRERANKMGIKFSAQSMKPFIDNLYALGQADIVYANSNFMALPTAKNIRSQQSAYMTAKMTASAGSIYGRFVSSESFTAKPEANRWLNHPEFYKPQADIDLAAGVNQITHHLFTHQPWTTLKPGMTLNYWGVHFDRTQTWWHEISTWNQYLTRTQAMLRQGQPVFDILYLLGDDSSTKADKDFIDKILPKGYDFEFISSHGLLNELNVNSNKKLGYKTGRQYSLLMLADDTSMRPEILYKIEQLLEQGAIVVGKPPTFSPSLKNKVNAENTLNQTVKRIWGGHYNKQVFGTLESAIEAINIQPDLQLIGANSKIQWRHHTLADNNIDFYFISNVGAKPTEFEARFRVTGKVPELWNPLTGERKHIHRYKVKDGQTIIALKLDQIESYFIVFTPDQLSQQPLNNAPLTQVQTITGNWKVDFIKGVQQPKAIILNPLLDLKEHTIDDVKYFAGTARYSINFDFNDTLNKDYTLDLGQAHQFARVTLNGQNLGVQMWSPYRFNITDALKKGKNTLTIDVTNLWPNRLIGDERQYKDTASWKKNGYQGDQLVEFPAWLKGATPEQPYGRNTFATWKHWSKDDDLIPSGLIGPVTLLAQ